jgi:hypothetical protein
VVEEDVAMSAADWFDIAIMAVCLLAFWHRGR